MRRNTTLGAAVALSLFACATAQAQVANPAKFFSREPDYSNPTMSPTGDYVAVDTPDNAKSDNRALALIRITGKPERNLFRFYGSTDRWDRPVIKEPYSATWAGDDRIIVFEGYDYGIGGSKFASGNVYSTSADAKTGERETVESFNDEVYVSADNTGKARINYRYDLQDNQIVQYRPTPDSEWKPMPDSLKGKSISFWFFEPDNNIAYAKVSEHGEAAQLFKVNLSAGTRERIAGQPTQEISDYE